MTTSICSADCCVNVNFFGESELFVTIDTEDLYIRSVDELDFTNYQSLFGNQDEMEKYADGKPYEAQKTRDRINDWVNRWKNQNPYSGFAVFKKEEDSDRKTFIGHIVLGYSEEGAGVSELAFLFKKACRGQGYGSQAVNAIVNHYAPQTVERKYTLKGKPLERIIATVKVDNEPSISMLENAGMKKEKEITKYDAERYLYAITLRDILHQFGQGARSF